ncbi:Glycosyl transferase, group 1 [Flavobacterium enshiense DK69]|nr:Glycosyl transferase, group 1 [Flavobacterium enshiense DK69]
MGAFLEQEGYQVFFFSSKKNQIVRLLDMCFAVVSKSRKVEFVIIDTYSTSSFWYAFVTSQLCRFFRLPYVPILRGGNLPQRLKASPRLSKMVFKYAYQNVVPSYYLLEAFRKAGFENLIFIPNTIEMGNYPFKQRDELRPKLLWVRAFATIYNPKMAVDVLYELQKKYPEAELCMVGPDKDGSMKTTQSYAEEKDVSVHFTGRLSKEEWILLSSDYDIFINTTHFDNTPVSVMEAMALGFPVVTTNVGGIPFLLNDNEDALLVKDNDVKGMVRAVEDLITQSEISQRITNNARKKAESWDWEVVKEQWMSLLQ